MNSIARTIICASTLYLSSSAATMNGVTIPDHELIAIHSAVERNVPDKTIRPYMTKLLVAIRLAENGAGGRQFGIMNDAARTLDQQAGWCAATCYKHWLRWNAGDRELPYLVSLRDRYCPIGADNDPKGLNKNWLPNVVSTLLRLQGDK